MSYNTTVLIRKKEAAPQTLIPTITDDALQGEAEARLAGQGYGNPELDKLSEEVRNMASVFEEANKAREEQRKIMDEMHQDLLRRIQSVRDYMTQEVKRLEATLASFYSKFEHELRQMRETLMTKLNAKISEVRAKIAKLNQRIDELDKKLQDEIRERKQHMEDILVPIQKDVAQLVVQLEEEKSIRQSKEAQYHKQLQDAVDLLEKNLDVEKFNREQQYMDFKVLGEYERERILKRQYVIEYEMKRMLDGLDLKIADETTNRLECQDGIVGNMTTFIKAFQENIKEEATMG